VKSLRSACADLAVRSIHAGEQLVERGYDYRHRPDLLPVSRVCHPNSTPCALSHCSQQQVPDTGQPEVQMAAGLDGAGPGWPDTEHTPAESPRPAGRLLPGPRGGRAHENSVSGPRRATAQPPGSARAVWPEIPAAAYLASGPLVDLSGR
jgi:hypothetical protein